MVGDGVTFWCHIPNFRSLCKSILSWGVFEKLIGVGGRVDGWIFPELRMALWWHLPYFKCQFVLSLGVFAINIGVRGGWLFFSWIWVSTVVSGTKFQSQSCVVTGTSQCQMTGQVTGKAPGQPSPSPLSTPWTRRSSHRWRCPTQVPSPQPKKMTSNLTILCLTSILSKWRSHFDLHFLYLGGLQYDVHFFKIQNLVHGGNIPKLIPHWMILKKCQNEGHIDLPVTKWQDGGHGPPLFKHWWHLF